MTIYLISEALQYYFGLLGLSGAAVAPTGTCQWGGRYFSRLKYLVSLGGRCDGVEESSLAVR